MPCTNMTSTDSRAPLPGERGFQPGCGCCAGPVEDRCCCHIHQDAPRGLLPHKCSMHAKAEGLSRGDASAEAMRRLLAEEKDAKAGGAYVGEWEFRDARDEPPPEPEDRAICDPLYGERMDSADMGEC